MRLLCLAIALLVSAPLVAQEKGLQDKKPPAKKSAAKKTAANRPAPKVGARQQATPEQIRKFNELQKKQQKAQP